VRLYIEHWQRIEQCQQSCDSTDDEQYCPLPQLKMHVMSFEYMINAKMRVALLPIGDNAGLKKLKHC
jgi:hypothetical protein